MEHEAKVGVEAAKKDERGVRIASHHEIDIGERIGSAGRRGAEVSGVPDARRRCEAGLDPLEDLVALQQRIGSTRAIIGILEERGFSRSGFLSLHHRFGDRT
jgi:hypothetical protein